MPQRCGSGLSTYNPAFIAQHRLDKKMIGSRLTTQIQLAAVALVAIAGLTLVYILDRHQRDTVLTHFDAELDDGVRLNGVRLAQTVDVLRQDALFLSRTPPVAGIVRAAQHGGVDPRDGNAQAVWNRRLQEIFSAFAEAHPNYFLIRYIGVADGGRELVRVERRDGVLAVVPEAGLRPKAEREFFAATTALKPGEIYLSDFGYDRFERAAGAPRLRVLRAATPIFDPAGKIFGLVMLNLDAGPVLDAISSGLPPGVDAYIADQEGHYLAHPDAARAFRFDAASSMARDFPELAMTSAGDHQALVPVGGPNGRQYVTAQRVRFDPRRPDRYVQLAYAVSQQAIEGEIAPTRYQAAGGGILAAGSVAFLLLLLVQRLLSPLHRITTAAEAIATGARDVALPETGRGGIGALVEAFRHMLASIAAREHDYQRLTSELEDRVRERTAKLRLAASVFENTSEGVVVTDETARIVSVNGAFTEITGYTAAEALGQKPSLLRSDHQDAEFYHAMWRQLLDTGRWQGEIWNRRKGGAAYLEWLTINRIPASDGIPGSYVAVFNDVTEQRRKDEHIRHLAFHDPLTGLPNRALLQDRLQHAIDRASREKTRLAVIFIDLDRFKGINDTLGHDVGDILLQEVAGRIKTHLRSMDTVARMGGDEFVVLFEDLSEPEHCASLATDIIADVAQPLDIQGNDISIGASLGIACFPEDGDDALALMKHADTAMYAAKAEGRGTYRFFRADMMELASLRLQLEIELRHAIANGELELYYQPKVCVDSGANCGVEALVRWHHPVRGLVSPADFIPVAEESDLIIDIGDWVINEACRQSAAWQALGLTPTIAVNVSAKQLRQNTLVERIVATAERHGIPPSRLQVEVTESLVMADPKQASALLHRLREIGVTVAIDDFGTGYSSLSYLRRLPIDVIKIDRSFVMNADRVEEDAQIVRTIIALAQALKMTVVAEGVETEAQAALLRSLGCTAVQGYLYARPGPAAQVPEWLRR
ncbi:MAG: EAL domain-containing protein [Rhodocyclaceae bacterium]|nr:EAL domain-containing protein [Rhodocyclaceae bacterium]